MMHGTIVRAVTPQTGQPRPPRQRINLETFTNLTRKFNQANALIQSFEADIASIVEDNSLSEDTRELNKNVKFMQLANLTKEFLTPAQQLINLINGHPALKQTYSQNIIALNEQITYISVQADALTLKHPEFSQLLRATSAEQ